MSSARRQTEPRLSVPRRLLNTKHAAPTARLLMLFCALWLLNTPRAAHSDTAERITSACLECHEDSDTTLAFADGREVSVYVNAEQLAASVHSDLSCAACHPGYDPQGHESPDFASQRTFLADKGRICTQCHSFEATLHGRMLQSQAELLCRDCHGAAHKIGPSAQQGCMGCHSRRLSLKMADGESLSLQVKASIFAGSAHAALGCAQCHSKFSEQQHPSTPYENRRQLRTTMAAACAECHDGGDTLHADLRRKQSARAPICVDCHRVHASVSLERASLVDRCGDCHVSVFNLYAESVHGSALHSGSPDVPGCADCHAAHAPADKAKQEVRLAVPQLCGDCHGDAALMARYKLSPYVVESYLDDFHGVTASLYKSQAETGEQRKKIAVCVDCHGIHDIQSTRGEGTERVKENMLQRCRECHPDASASFPDAWLSHYPPTLSRAPIVYLVSVGYKILIPFIVLGLVVQILLHLWRHVKGR